ncbi:MAG: methylmalonyl-CoA carboxyltransferase, partial [Chloroflexota bacterium]|nr:methylmalonyl-CoA carboxyltransferase [Chloroflexota bacterium]
MEDHLSTLRAMREQAVIGGGPKRIAQQHARGKLTARERLALLLDEGSFVEDGLLANAGATDLPADGVVTG